MKDGSRKRVRSDETSWTDARYFELFIEFLDQKCPSTKCASLLSECQNVQVKE
jgi:hypothetical protein